MANLQQLVDELSKLTVLEAAELSKLLEEKWGVSAAAPVAMAAAPGAAAAPAAVEKTEFPFGGQILPVTISLGVAGLPQVDTNEPFGLISAADDALYKAKRAGRNQVCSAPVGPVTTPVVSMITQTRS